MTDLIALVNEQAEDEGLWFIDATCSEAYLQAALRKLHAAIETAGVAATQPTDEQVETACAVYAKATGYYVEFHPGLSSESSNGIRRGMRAALAAVTRPAPEHITDEALNAHLRATGEWVNPHEAETESGMEIECGMTQEAADQINAEQRELLRKGYVAAFSVSSTEGNTHD